MNLYYIICMQSIRDIHHKRSVKRSWSCPKSTIFNAFLVCAHRRGCESHHRLHGIMGNMSHDGGFCLELSSEPVSRQARGLSSWGINLHKDKLLPSSFGLELILHRHRGLLLSTHSLVCQWQCELLPSADNPPICLPITDH